MAKQLKMFSNLHEFQWFRIDDLCTAEVLDLIRSRFDPATPLPVHNEPELFDKRPVRKKAGFIVLMRVLDGDVLFSFKGAVSRYSVIFCAFLCE